MNNVSQTFLEVSCKFLLDIFWRCSPPVVSSMAPNDLFPTPAKQKPNLPCKVSMVKASNR